MLERCRASPSPFTSRQTKSMWFVGTMLNVDGENLTDPKVQELVQGPQNEKAWSTLEKRSTGYAMATNLRLLFTPSPIPTARIATDSVSLPSPGLIAGEVAIAYMSWWGYETNTVCQKPPQF